MSTCQHQPLHDKRLGIPSTMMNCKRFKSLSTMMNCKRFKSEYDDELQAIQVLACGSAIYQSARLTLGNQKAKR
ncbi:1901_t:CDS:2, partial [Paraglomus brasilianum]